MEPRHYLCALCRLGGLLAAMFMQLGCDAAGDASPGGGAGVAAAGVTATAGTVAGAAATAGTGIGAGTGAAGVVGGAGVTAGFGGAAGTAADGGIEDGALAQDGASEPEDAAVPTCPPAPGTASPEAAAALEAVNAVRLATGAGCATMVQALNDAALNHCNYYAANKSINMCVADAHSEVSTCSMYTGESFGDRATHAGFTGQGAFEVMAFSNNAASAVNQWLESVWHRIPVLNPWITELGYGNATGCDTMDFGRGTPGPNDAVVFYPYEGQTNVPTSFNGKYEGPEPPAPPSGWPSGEVITVYAKNITVTEHVLTKDGDPTPLPHVWLTSADSGFLKDDIMMYSHAPLASQTKYRVKITGTFIGGPLNLEWTFTTK